VLGVVPNIPILVVEDDALSAKLLMVLLRAEGHDVRWAISAEDALARLEEFRPRAIIVDLVLPLMSGLVLIERLKADPKTRDIVVIGVSAFGGLPLERMALGAGCAAYVSKPIDPLVFDDLLQLHLGGN
jgi:CheY-like chemotaxis protein